MPPRRRRLRALVLAAGLGTRLRPLSTALPKPLFPVCGLPILGRTLEALAGAGCEAAAINLHYLGAPIRRRFGDSFAGMPLVYSTEPEILGTLGALQPLGDFLQPADLVFLINGDSLCRWPLAQMVRAHLRAGGGRGEPAPLATLLLSRRADTAEFGGGVAVDDAGQVTSLRGDGSQPGDDRLVFAGAHVLSPELLARIRERPAGPADIVRDLYDPLLAAARSTGASPLRAVATDRVWHDLGTPRRYLDGVLDWLRASGRGAWTAPAAKVAASASLRRAVVESGAAIGDGARLERTIVLAGAVVGAGSVVRCSIVGPGAVLPPGSRLDGQLAMPGEAGEPDEPATRLTPLGGAA